MDQDRSIVIRRQPMERMEARVEGGGVPRPHARPRGRAWAGVLSANPEAVARAIEDLGRSGYRPLRLPADGALDTAPWGLRSPPHGGTRETATTDA